MQIPTRSIYGIRLSSATYLPCGSLFGIAELDVHVVRLETRVGVHVIELLSEVFLDEKVHPGSEIVELIFVISLDVETDAKFVVEEVSLDLQNSQMVL